MTVLLLSLSLSLLAALVANSEQCYTTDSSTCSHYTDDTCIVEPSTNKPCCFIAASYSAFVEAEKLLDGLYHTFTMDAACTTAARAKQPNIRYLILRCSCDGTTLSFQSKHNNSYNYNRSCWTGWTQMYIVLDLFTLLHSLQISLILLLTTQWDEAAIFKSSQR